MTPAAQVPVPANPAIFHITHVDNLPGILAEGGLWSDADRLARGFSNVNIGHRHIKQRRLSRPVETRADGVLGAYVPFNFCPRSVMLYAVSCGHTDYAGGQDSVVHLVSSVHVATRLGRAWAFSDRHAELAHALHFDDLTHLGEVAWHVMPQKYWADVKEERQAEFLVHQFFPWAGVAEVAAMNTDIAARVSQMLSLVTHKPAVTVKPEWYY